MASDGSTMTVSSNKNSTVKGKTTIADSVVSTIAGIATRETSGVYAMGGGASRALGAVRGRMGSDDLTRGVKVEVGEKQTAIDLTVVVEYGTPIAKAAEDIQSGVSDAVESMTGLEVAEVNISVLDVHVPGEDDNDDDSDNDGTRLR